jgi:hypothetical protein
MSSNRDKYHGEVIPALKKVGWWVRSTPTLPPNKQKSIIRSSADIIGINTNGRAAFFEVKTAPKGTLQIGGTDTGWKIHQINWASRIQDELNVVVWLPVMFDGIDSPFPRIKRALYIIPADSLLDYWYTWGSVQNSLVYSAKKNYAIEFQRNKVDAIHLFSQYAVGYNANDKWTIGNDHPLQNYYR